MSRQATTLFAIVLLLSVTAPQAWAQPEHVSYQGHLLTNGQPVTGTANFKFAIITDAGNVTLWSNDGSSAAGGEPSTSLPLNVDDGIFSVRLGDVATGQIPLLADFLDGVMDAALRVWVDTGSGFEQLTDQPVSSSAFTLQADAAKRALGDFSVPGSLVAGVVTTNSLVLPDAAIDGYVLTSDPLGVASWQPAPTGSGTDNDWTVVNGDMFSSVTGNVGIGTASPAQKLHVAGVSRFELAGDRWIDVSTPGGWPGFIAISPNTHRRDIIFDDSGMRLLAGSTSGPPGASSGITIAENGWVGIDTLSPQTNLHVSGEALATSYKVKNSGWTDAFLGGDGTVGGVLELHGPSGATDYGISLKGASDFGGGVLDLYNASNAVSLELIGDYAGTGGGSLLVGNGSIGTIFVDGNVGGGGQYRATNSAGAVTLSLAGQAYSSGSQVRLYDATGTLSHEMTAGAHETKMFNTSGANTLFLDADNGGGAYLSATNGSTNTFTLQAKAFGSASQLRLYDSAGVISHEMTAAAREMKFFDSTGASSVIIRGSDGGGDGRVTTDVLEITGGADLSESFDINGDAEVEPGMVVCIDPSDTGKLVQSRKPYARTVAGIVSGAGGVKPGMLMGQRGSIADGKHPVALTGRVWTWCDASSGPIEPGDLLTTSATPGHAMKVADHSQANGAILGKAMSRLAEGRGLVLVLVSLQ